MYLCLHTFNCTLLITYLNELRLLHVQLKTGGAISVRLSAFPPKTRNNLFKFSAQEGNLTPFVSNGTKVKITFEIRPPLADDINEQNKWWLQQLQTYETRNSCSQTKKGVKRI